MAKKQTIIDGVTYDLGAEAQNVDYTNEDMTGVTNAKGALDNLHSRLDAIENPSDIVAEYSEADATTANMRLWGDGSEHEDSSYKSTGYLTIPPCAKMFIKTDYAFSGTLLMVFYTAVGETSQSQLNIKEGGPYTDWTEIVIPGTKNYLRFTLSNNSFAIKFVEKYSNDVVKLKVASWNVEGFSQGSYETDPAINNSTVDANRKAYRGVIDSVNADIICFSEFYPKFNRDDNASTPQGEILCNYPYNAIGENYSYNMNAVFSKLPILHIRKIHFTNQTNNYTRNFIETTLRLNGKDVKVVATHFDFQEKDLVRYPQNAGQDNSPQFREIISRYANEPYVIICADFNVHTWDHNGEYVSGDQTDGYLNYQYFTDAGYTLLNFDYLILKNPKDASEPGEFGEHIADNIAVKGFAMGKREYIAGTYGQLSDHPMVACELVML